MSRKSRNFTPPPKFESLALALVYLFQVWHLAGDQEMRVKKGKTLKDILETQRDLLLKWKSSGPLKVSALRKYSLFKD